MPYRADIDGLRAVAVLSVFAFHLGLYSIARGGFVGVDIFFVISGYLITGIIRREIEAGTFSLATFYRRRALRILPAFIAMAVVVAAGTLWLLPPVEAVEVGKSIAAASLSVSNVLFYFSPGGYFFDELSARPMLHTWSLGVEEQFYFIFPLLLIAGYKLAHRQHRLLIALLGISSLAVSIVTLRIDPNGAFFLLPARFWELMIGAAAALGMIRLPQSQAWRELLALLGVAAMGWALFTVDGSYLPLYWAIIPCVGAVLVLLAGEGNGTLVSRALAMPPLVWIGLISYSLYLWHWPVIVLARFGLLLPLTMSNRALIVAVTFALAVASWWLIERPFRRLPKVIPNSRVLSRAVAALASIAIVGSSFVVSAGFPQRFTDEAVQVSNYLNSVSLVDFRAGSCFISSPEENFDWARCMGAETGKPRVILFGDSHAAELWPGLSPHTQRYDIRQVTATYCPGLVGVYTTGLPFCAAVMDRFFKEYLAGRHPQDTVLLSQRWKIMHPDALRETIRKIRGTGAKVVLVGPTPEYTTALPRLQFVSLVRNDPGLAARARDMAVHATDITLQGIARDEQAGYVSLVQALCDVDNCQAYAAPNVPMMLDTDHLTPAGAKHIAPLLLAAIDRQK